VAKQRQMKVQQRSSLEAMQQLETRTDEELKQETRHRAAALAILGARAAEKYDAEAARDYFQRAIAAARPQERRHLRRMANASLALAERRPDDLKEAVQKLGQAPPSSRQLFLLRVMGILAPPQGASTFVRVRGIVLLIALVLLLAAIGFGIVTLISLPFGGAHIFLRVLLGLVLIVAVLGVLVLLGRRRQAKARAKAAAGG
jgi:hypothetical protein